MRIKLKTSDRIFSQCIRERAGWKCERCGAQHHEKSKGLHCSHFKGRASYGLRWDVWNCSSICYGCHQYLGSHPLEHDKFMREKIGDAEYDLLIRRGNDRDLGRRAVRSEKEIRAHYRKQLERLKAERAFGETDLLLENWA